MCIGDDGGPLADGVVERGVTVGLQSPERFDDLFARRSDLLVTDDHRGRVRESDDGDEIVVPHLLHELHRRLAGVGHLIARHTARRIQQHHQVDVLAGRLPQILHGVDRLHAGRAEDDLRLGKIDVAARVQGRFRRHRRIDRPQTVGHGQLLSRLFQQVIAE